MDGLTGAGNDNLQDVARLPSFHAATCLAFELDHPSPATALQDQVVLQLALQYTCLSIGGPAAGTADGAVTR